MPFSLKKNAGLSPVFILRIGLGFTMLYASLHMFFDPTSWIGFVPQWVGNIIDPNIFLMVHSVFEFIFGIFLLGGIFLPAVSLLSFLDFAAILVFYGLDDLTFRDIGLALAALALFTFTLKEK